MFHFILFVIAAIIIFVLVKKTYQVILGVLFGSFYFAGFVVNKILKVMKVRLVFLFLTFVVGALLSLAAESILFFLSSVLFIVALYCHLQRTVKESIFTGFNDGFDKSIDEFYIGVFSAAFIIGIAFVLKLTGTTNYYLDYISLAVGVFLMAVKINDEIERASLITLVAKEFGTTEKHCYQGHVAELTKNNTGDQSDVANVYNLVAQKFIDMGSHTEVTLNNNRWFVTNKLNSDIKNLIRVRSISSTRLPPLELANLVKKDLGTSKEESLDYIFRYVTHGDVLDFEEGKFFVAYRNYNAIKKCTSCGIAHISNSSNVESGSEWFCSDICENTESACIEIKNKPMQEFLSDAAAVSFTLMEGAAAWSNNHKLFATGGQGHGFAAENANNKIDTLMMKDAKIVGGDNAKNGADRIVDGQSLQTKYCDTGARSVGAAFDNKGDGLYRYIDSSGEPMILEVPKDQYDKAVETMAKKIQEGKVPGVSNPADAEKYVRAGHLTYDQAKNITRFGTFESITYDISEGVIVGSIAGGISFGITALVSYMQTNDSKLALRIATIQAGKTFGKTICVYVAAQQLHRVSAVQGMLKIVDVSSLSSSSRALLQDGLGVTHNANGIAGHGAINKALRGTIITSIAVIAVTTGPDLIKMARGHISNAQFIKNLTVTTSSVTGGVVGSMAGGALGASLGPMGIMFGRFAGGMLGGMIAATISNKILGELIEDDRVKMLAIIQEQMEYHVRIFILNEKEIACLVENMGKLLTKKALELLYASDNRRSLANAYVKPVVVGVIKQRPSLSYSSNDIIEACEAVA
ncbi:hypothetical protein K4H28_01465 [Deefgea tanakiae]|uniref:Inner membrane protein yeeR n=1 Tax=Deefgea tanakiae TaxID=2865840 RepID=A0ABX8Z6B5_9NEIS|nr:hypothetical protein [Deefgea tanakiae]QZA78132.1 hypothetical protein K4H28_01465 [Deefgea tanakiae]